MGNIVLLDDSTINKIAAGEVIERPASVVKELVENSIDAGATNITVEIKNGGISYIRITDNGKGFEKDDMEIAFERHATSKIRHADDLQFVKSMGFRGEALASIAAISKIELKSKTANSDIGNRITLEAGRVTDFTEDGCQNGSIITIEDLFFNTPVRYKFLRKDFTESGYIEDVVTRIALANPDIAIKLINTGKTVIQTTGTGDIKNVIFNIYGKDISQNVIEVNYEYENIKVYGVVGKPEIARSNRSNQIFFVNKRYVKDKTLTMAAEQVYKGLVPAGKFGFLVLNIDMNPEEVDVNVHPAKLEVRFEDENKIYKAVYHAIKDELIKEDIAFEEEKKNDIGIEKKEFKEKESITEEQVGKTSLGLFQRLLNKNKAKENYLSNDVNNSENVNSSEDSFENNAYEDFDEEEDKNNLIAQIFEKRRALKNKELQDEEEQKEETEKVEEIEEEKQEPETIFNDNKEEIINNDINEEVVDFIEDNSTEEQKEVYEENKEEFFDESFEELIKDNQNESDNIENIEQVYDENNTTNNEEVQNEEDNSISIESEPETETESEITENNFEENKETVGEQEQVIDNEQIEEPAIVEEEGEEDIYREIKHNIESELEENSKENENQSENIVDVENEIKVEDELESEPELDMEKTQNVEGNTFEENDDLVEQTNVMETIRLDDSEKFAVLDRLEQEQKQEQENIEDNKEQTEYEEIEIKLNPKEKFLEELEKVEQNQAKENAKASINYEKEDFDEIYSSVFGVKPVRKNDAIIEEEPEKYTFEDSYNVGENVSIFEDEENVEKNISYKFVGTAFKTCFLIEIKQDLYIIDQNVARQKIIYEELKEKYNLR